MSGVLEALGGEVALMRAGLNRAEQREYDKEKWPVQDAMFLLRMIAEHLAGGAVELPSEARTRKEREENPRGRSGAFGPVYDPDTYSVVAEVP